MTSSRSLKKPLLYALIDQRSIASIDEEIARLLQQIEKLQKVRAGIIQEEAVGERHPLA